MPQNGAVTVELVRGAAVVATLLVPLVEAPDLATVDHLARLALTARRLGCSIRLRHVDRGLAELMDLAGLTEVVSLQVVRETEGGEERGGEEAVVPDDPVA